MLSNCENVQRSDWLTSETRFFQGQLKLNRIKSVFTNKIFPTNDHQTHCETKQCQSSWISPFLTGMLLGTLTSSLVLAIVLTLYLTSPISIKTNDNENSSFYDCTQSKKWSNVWFIQYDSRSFLDIGVTNNFWSRSRNGHDEFGHGHVTVTIEICRDRDRESRQFY